MPFSSDIELINKNTTVTVARSPLENGKKKVWEEEPLTGIPLQLAMAGGTHLGAHGTHSNGAHGGAAHSMWRTLFFSINPVVYV